ncbi:hypothetical protein WS74_0826 [Weissella ceti]|uniref:Uncharacterized protein n=2 Tax=Weissella ceti TaxID=759620 RepID=A0A088GG42_9LACO|nr:hypothetical protein WS74_0826 [Weissella ceti]
MTITVILNFMWRLPILYIAAYSVALIWSVNEYTHKKHWALLATAILSVVVISFQLYTIIWG